MSDEMTREEMAAIAQKFKGKTNIELAGLLLAAIEKAGGVPGMNLATASTFLDIIDIAKERS